MFNKFSNKKLVIVFSILLFVVVLMFVLDSNPNESTFKKDIIDINKDDVTSISIFPKVNNHKEVKLFKEGNDWKVTLNKDKTAIVPKEKIDGLLNVLAQIKPKRVAAKSSSKWKNFQVDSSGTQVKVFEDGDLSLDIVIGKYVFKQPRALSSYVRLADEDNVYEVNGILSITFNHKPDYFRDFHLVFDSFNNWNKVTFTYPADSSFTLTKKGDKWFIGGQLTDSAKTVNYLNSIQTLTNSNFVDNPDKESLSKAFFTITIESKDKGTIVITSFGNDENAIIHSSMRPEVYFKAGAKAFLTRTFVGRMNFF